VRNKAKAKIQLSSLVNASALQLERDEDIAESLNEYFSSVFTEDDDRNLSVPIDMLSWTNTACTDVVFSEDDVAKTLAKVRPDKASGPDEL